MILVFPTEPSVINRVPSKRSLFKRGPESRPGGDAPWVGGVPLQHGQANKK